MEHINDKVVSGFVHQRHINTSSLQLKPMDSFGPVLVHGENENDFIFLMQIL